MTPLNQKPYPIHSASQPWQIAEKRQAYGHVMFPSIPTGSSDEIRFITAWETTSASVQSQLLLTQTDPDVLQRIKILKQKFAQELSQYPSYLTAPYQPETISAWFAALSSLGFSNSAVELVPDNILKVTLVLPFEYMLMISFSVAEPDELPVFSLFRNREVLISGQRPLGDVLSGTAGMIQEA